MKKVLIIMSLLSSILLGEQLTKPLGSMEGTDGIVFQKGKIRTVFKNANFEKDKTYDNNDLVKNTNSQSMLVNKSVAVVRYGLGSNMELKAIIPYIDKEKKSINSQMNNIGLGDIVVEGRYQLKSPKKKDNYFLALTFGASFPSGDTDKSFGLKEAKDTMPLQLGKGSINPIVAIGFTKFYNNSFRLDGGVKYTYNIKGAHEYQFGQELNYDLSIAKGLNKNFIALIEINGRFEDRDKKRDKILENTKSNIVYFTPGVQYKINNNFDLGGSIAIPVYRNYSGNMLGEEMKLFFRLAYTM